MPRVAEIKTNMARGELAPRAVMRSDTRAFQDALARAANVALLAHGGGRRRPGTWFVDDLTVLGPLRFEEFVYGPSQAYLLVFFPSGLRIYLTDGTLATALANQPWTAAMLPKLSVTQSGNVMIVSHPDMEQRVITRTGALSFTAAPLEWGTGGASAGDAPILAPFYRFHDDVTLQPSAYSGTVTVTASKPIFTSQWVDTIVRYAGTEIELTAYVSATQMTGVARETLAKCYDYPVSDSAGFLPGQRVISTGGDAEGVIVSKPNATTLRVLMLDRAQAFEYEALVIRYLVSGTTSARLTAAGAAVATPPATGEWDELAFSAHRGWPQCAAFHEQRLVIGGSRSLPIRLFLSAVGDFFNMDEGLGEDSAAFAVNVTYDGISEIRHLVSHRHLHVFTDGGECYAPQSESQPLTPFTITVRRQTRYGCSWVRPVPFDGSTLFVDLAGQAVREFVYTDLETAYTSPPLSVMSSHLIRQPVDMDAQIGSDMGEEQYLFVVNADGSLAVHHGLKKEEINGWTPWTTDGAFKRVRVVDGFVFLATERSVNGSTRTYLERLDPDLTLDSCLAIQEGTTAPKLAHLPGKTLHAVKDCGYYGTWTADALGEAEGLLALPNCVAGLDYAVALTTLPLFTINGSDVGHLPKRILRCAVWVHESVTFDVQGHTLAVYTVTDDLGAVPAPKTGAYEFRLLGWSKTAQVTITQAYPLPLTILGLLLEVSA